MQSAAKDVDSYLKEVPAERLAALKQLRKLCLAELRGAEECIDYGMPCYKRDGTVVVAFASQKNYISLYGCGAAIFERHRKRLTGIDNGKGCIRFKKQDHIDFAIVREMLKDKQATSS